jgi:cysteine synthase A
MRTTAKEILADFGNERLDAFVTGTGTGGTLLGVGRVLKATDPRIRIVVAEPDNAPILSSGIPQSRDDTGRPTAQPSALPAAPHPGMDARFHPAPDGNGDRRTPRRRESCRSPAPKRLRLARALATTEGIFVGPSSGATLAAAIDVARRSAPGANIVCMLPDTGERYLSTPLFDEIRETMDEAELAISHSTPGQRFDSGGPKAAACAIARAATAAKAIATDAKAVDFVQGRRSATSPSCCSRWSGASSAGRCAVLRAHGHRVRERRP